MYVKRNEQQVIVALSVSIDGDINEYLADDSRELQEFLRQDASRSKALLEESDQSMVRVLEDVINLLVNKGTIRFTDLPPAAQSKLLSRKELRGYSQGMNLLDDEENLKF